MDREEVKQRVIAIATELYALAASSYGPTGRVKVLQPNEDSPDAVEVTTIAERICNRIGTSECPVANVYLHILKSRVRNHADGGLLTMLLSAKLQLMAQDGVLSHVPQHHVVQGFQVALEWCLAYLDDLACPIRVAIDWSNTIALLSTLRGIIGSKAVATAETSAKDSLPELLPLLVETFVSVLPFVLEHPRESIPVRFTHDAAYASSLRDSRVLKNAILLDLHHHTSEITKLLPLTNVRALLFCVSLDPSRSTSGDTEDMTNGITANIDPSDEMVEAALRRLGDDMAATGVRVVLCQKLIPAFLQRHLATKGIVAIQRLGITHMRAVQLLTGATALGDWCSIPKSSTQTFGFLSSVSIVTVNHKEMLLLQNAEARSHSSSSWPVTTLVLSARNEHAYTELVHVVTTCLKRLAVMMEAPDALAGAGCAEIHLAAWVRRHADHLVVSREAYEPDSVPASDRSALRHLRSVVYAFADALESVVVALDHGVHGLTDEVIQKMREANSQTLHELPETPSFSLFGWDPAIGDPVCVATVAQVDPEESSSDDDDIDSNEETVSRRLVSAFVLDAMAVKRDALVTAVECATTLLRIATVIHTSP